MKRNSPITRHFGDGVLLRIGLICGIGIIPLILANSLAAKPPAKKPAARPAPPKPASIADSSAENRADRINAAMKKAIDYLYAHYQNGNWEHAQTRDPADGTIGSDGRQWTGLTALTIYALLSAGESPSDKRLSAATDFLMANPSEGVYSSCCRCLVWSRLTQTQAVRAAGQKDVNLLLSAVKEKGEAKGLMYYSAPKPEHAAAEEEKYDHSVSQMGALGLSVMVPLGYEVPRKFWAQTQQAWQNHQYADGAWSYVFNAQKNHGMHTASMSAAGVATLFITQNLLGGSSECQGTAHDPHIENGLKWLATNFGATFDVKREMNESNIEGYALFAISRVGVASGLRYFGKVDWFQEGADYLLATQKPDGSWPSSIPGGTPLSLLFLAYGSSPIVFNKLQYSTAAVAGTAAGEQWNQRPQDLLNFVDWMGYRLERRLNWQVVDLSAPVAAMHDAPILVIAGSQPLNFSESERNKLRQFVSEGGMILGNSDCGRTQFADSFTKLGTQLFPAYEFRELPASHPIFTNEQYHTAQFKQPPHVSGLTNGVRELMLLPGEDLSREFQQRASAIHPDSYQLLADIVLYAVDTSGLTRRGKTYLARENPAAPISRTIKLARLQYSGNWDPEPGGWTRLQAVLHNTQNLALKVETVKLGDGKLSATPAAADIAHLTGTAAIKFTDAERQDVKQFVAAGGTLIFDAAGGSTQFAESVEQMLTDTFGADARQIESPLEPGSPIYQQPGNVVKEVQYRQFARSRVSSGRTPQLRGIKIGGRMAIIYSREDLSAGLVGEPVDGITGYSTASATELMTGIILSSGSTGAIAKE